MDREDRLKIAIVAVILAVDAVGIHLLGLRFDWPSAVKVIVAWVGLMGAGWFYLRQRVDPQISHLTRETAHLAAFTAVAAVLSYLAASLARPLVDDQLVRADALMGFDWAAYVGFVNERPWLGRLSSIVYMSTLPQVAIAAILLPLLGLVERARELVLAVMFAALIAIAVSAWLPSAGALAYYHPSSDFLAPNAPIVDLAYKQEFFRMRDLAIPVLSLDGAKGLIAFPSYHVALSVLIALAFRGHYPLFAPLAILNLAVILSTPVDGGHHMSDALSGAALGFLSLYLAGRIRAWLGRSTAGEPASGPAGTEPSPAVLAPVISSRR